jgi:hypothetical protein
MPFTQILLAVLIRATARTTTLMQRMLPRYVGLTFALLALVTSASADNDANDDINLDFSVISGLTGGPTSYLDGIKEMP